jgi:hypothetical protein
MHIMNRLFSAATLALLAGCGSADAASDSPRGEPPLAEAGGTQQLPSMIIYKTATCGCCQGWVEHMRAAGFALDVRDLPGNVELMGVKVDAGVPGQVASCHTALVDGYVVEGHVPAEQVKRLLAERPAVAGIGVPGMPVGSPGMEGPNPQPYQVVSWDHDGSAAVFAEISPR